VEPLFDDCAICLGASFMSRPIGTLTDASVFSLSGFKILNFIWQGFIATKDAEQFSAISKEVASWPRLHARLTMGLPWNPSFCLAQAASLVGKRLSLHRPDQENRRDDADRVEKAGPTRSGCGVQHYAGRKRRRSISAAIERVLLSDGSASAASFAYDTPSLAMKRSPITHTSPARPKKLEWRER
jgi:hypothetical protein